MRIRFGPKTERQLGGVWPKTIERGVSCSAGQEQRNSNESFTQLRGFLRNASVRVLEPRRVRGGEIN